MLHGGVASSDMLVVHLASCRVWFSRNTTLAAIGVLRSTKRSVAAIMTTVSSLDGISMDGVTCDRGRTGSERKKGRKNNKRKSKVTIKLQTKNPAAFCIFPSKYIAHR